MEGPEFLWGQGFAPLELPAQGGVVHQPPACHPVGDGGELGGQLPAGLGGEEVPIVTQGEVAVVHGILKSPLTHRPPVKVPAEAGVDDKLPDGVAAENGQQGGPLRRILHPDPGFDGDGQVGSGENVGQEGVQRLGVGQKARPLPLGHHGTRGAAQVQVDLGIPQVLEHPGGGQEGLGLVGQQLGHHRHPLVVVWLEVRQPPPGEGAVGGGGEEGGVVPVQTGKASLVDLTKDPAGDPL